MLRSMRAERTSSVRTSEVFQAGTAAKVLSLAILLGLIVAQRGDSQDTPPDFASHGRAFIEKYCAQCHNAEKHEADLVLPSAADYEAVSKGRKTWEKVLKLVAAGEMPPSEAQRPTTAEAEQFTDLIATVFDYSDRHAKPNPGRVTMRRLNRVEYRNTIRDLVGIDFDPTENFPADDIGHGFDNIGDVLSLPPVLMERYLEAAESILSRAITPDLPPPTKRHQGGRYTEPAGGDVEKEFLAKNYRWITSDGNKPTATGPLNTPYKWEDDGEYVFRTKLYGESFLPVPPKAEPAPVSEGSEQAKGDSDKPSESQPEPKPTALPVKVAILVQGEKLEHPSTPEELAKIVGKVDKPTRILEIFEVGENDRDKPRTLEVRIPPMPGRDRMLVALVKPDEGAPPAKLYVESFVLEGPMDMRPASQRRLLAVKPDQTAEQQTREVLARFLRQAFRRMPTSEEIDRHAGLVARAMQEGAKWEAAMQLAMQAALCSPKFLFRVELDDRTQSEDAGLIDEFHLASRLSYFLWSTMPDDELLNLAEKGQLRSNLDAQIARMLEDDRSSSLVDNFAMQWLQLQRIESFSPDPKLFPRFTPELRRSMVSETKLFFQSIIREDRSILDLIDADYTYLNRTLADHYGLTELWSGGQEQRGRGRWGNRGGEGEQFKRVALKDGKRGGLLTQAGVLTVTSNPTRTSPVKRGRWVLEQILGAPPPPPPPNAPELPSDEKSVAGGSLRQRLEIHRQNPSCANCHAKMDPIGFALENFDAVGAYRTKDGEFDIDASGSFPDGSTFKGPEDLKGIVKSKKTQFARCLTEKLLTYAIGRGIEYYDRPTVEKIVQSMEPAGYKFSALIKQIVVSDAFMQRRGMAAVE